MRYCLLAFDYDGTAAVGGGLPSQRVQRAVAAAVAAGVHVVLATGRSCRNARTYAAALHLTEPLICFQGAMVRDCVGTCEPLLIETPPEEPLAEVLAWADALRLDLTLYSEDEVFLVTQRHPQEFYDRWFGLTLRFAPTLVEAREAMRREGKHPIKGLFIGQPDEVDRLQAEIVACFSGRLSVVRSHPMFVEVLAPGASKGNALAFLAARSGVSRREVMAVGDSGNDISMIRWAGLGVAMGNASADVIAAADHVAPSVHEDGLAVMIEEFVLRDGQG